MFFFNLLMLVFFAEIDLLERLYLFSAEHEQFELDEIIPMFFTLSLSLAVFSFRRWQEGKELHKALLAMATHDELTGVLNKRGIYLSLEEEIQRSKRAGFLLSIVLLDLDDLKQVNDQLGHACGDQILMQLGNTLQQSTRAIDKVARWGGDEFLILCLDTDSQGAARVAEKLKSTVEEFEFDHIGRRCTASIGTATLKKDDDLNSIFSRADSNLYQAKALGKNRFVAQS